MAAGEETSVVTEQIFFSGRVQGVGFRFTTRGIAKRFPVVGFVRNLPDSRVELVIRGQSTAIDDVVHRLTEHFGDNITHVDRTCIPPDEPFTTFDIRR